MEPRRRWARVVVVGALFIAGPCGAGAAGPAWDAFDPAVLAPLLFPESSRWMTIDRLPGVPAARIRQLRDPLTRRYLEIAESRRGSEADCSILDGIFDAAAADFRSLDVDGDKQADIVFAGANPCGEGEVSLVFFAPFDDEQVRAADLLPYRLLRVRAGQEARYLGFQKGCCDDPSSRFFVGTRVSVTETTVRVSRALSLPGRLAPPPRPAGAASGDSDTTTWTSAGETTLRSSPQRLDAYDPGESGHRNAAVFGNVLSKYMPGARGRLVAAWVGAAKEIWQLVLVDSTSRALAVHAPFDSDLGWVERSPEPAAAPTP